MLSVLWRFRWYPFTVNTPLEGRFQENISVEELRGVQDRFVGSSAIKNRVLLFTNLQITDNTCIRISKANIFNYIIYKLIGLKHLLKCSRKKNCRLLTVNINFSLLQHFQYSHKAPVSAKTKRITNNRIPILRDFMMKKLRKETK